MSTFYSAFLLMGGMVVLMACHNGRTADNDNGADTLGLYDPLTAADSLDDAFSRLDYPGDELVEEGEELSFADFFFMFTRDKAYQAQHVSFPLGIVNIAGDSTSITSGRAFRSLFHWPEDEDFTLLLTHEEEAEVFQTSLSLSKVTAELIDLDQLVLTCYDFEKKDGQWLLHTRRETKPQGTSGDFITFYSKFVSDSTYQHSHLSKQIRFSTYDPDDETQQMEGLLLPSQWDIFKPELPSGKITNFRFGQPLDDTNRIVVMLCGGSSGMVQTCSYRRDQEHWRLYAFDY